MLKDRLLRGELTIGSWLQLADPSLCEMMATSGFDWLVVDREHTSISLAEMGRLIRICDLAGCPVMVRVSSNDPAEIKKVMDAGGVGVIVPMVCSPAEAAAAVSAAYYPPRGSRGVGLSRAQRYGVGFDEYRAGADDQTIVIAQIEHIDAVENLTDIIAVDGVDGFFIGPYDLSASLGVPGQFDDPHFLAALEEIDRIRKTSSKVAGRHVVEPDHQQLRAAVDGGYQFIAFASEMLLLAHLLADTGRQLDALRSAR